MKLVKNILLCMIIPTIFLLVLSSIYLKKHLHKLDYYNI